MPKCIKNNVNKTKTSNRECRKTVDVSSLWRNEPTNNFKGDKVPDEIKPLVLKLLITKSNVVFFSIKNTNLDWNRNIDTSDHPPIKNRLYAVQLNNTNVFCMAIKEIHKVNFFLSYSIVVVIVNKTNCSNIICVDYRRLQKIVQARYLFILSSIDDIRALLWYCLLCVGFKEVMLMSFLRMF